MCNKYTIILGILSQLSLVDSSYNINCQNFKGGWEKQILEFLPDIFFSLVIPLWKNGVWTWERCRMWNTQVPRKNVFQCYVMKPDGWKWPSKAISFPWTTNAVISYFWLACELWSCQGNRALVTNAPSSLATVR